MSPVTGQPAIVPANSYSDLVANSWDRVTPHSGGAEVGGGAAPRVTDRSVCEIDGPGRAPSGRSEAIEVRDHYRRLRRRPAASVAASTCDRILAQAAQAQPAAAARPPRLHPAHVHQDDGEMMVTDISVEAALAAPVSRGEA